MFLFHSRKKYVKNFEKDIMPFLEKSCNFAHMRKHHI